jgi:N-acetyl-anhydromuramoyl-L-alanine amidase
MVPQENNDALIWKNGWFAPARAVISPNFGDRPHNANIDLIVIHSISLPPGQYGGPQIEALFTNQLDWSSDPYFEQIRDLEVSSHFVIRRTGEIVQFVSCNDRAWHAGRSHYRGRDNCNDDSIGIELEGLENFTFETAQYQSLQTLCSAIMKEYPIKHIAGHEHIAPGRKIDPGNKFDWLLLQKSLQLPDDFLPYHFKNIKN